jgi:hypothetical protein
MQMVRRFLLILGWILVVAGGAVGALLLLAVFIFFVRDIDDQYGPFAAVASIIGPGIALLFVARLIPRKQEPRQ